MSEQQEPRVRQFERAGLDLYINKIIGDEPHLARVRDISIGGVYLYKLLEPELEAGTVIGLELKLPSTEEVIWAVGEVVREEDALGDGVAIRFIRIAEHDREMIRKYVDAQIHTEDVVCRAAA